MDIKLNLSYYASIICLMLSKTYYAQNYAGIIGLGLSLTGQSKELIVKENPAPEEDEGETKVEEDKPAELQYIYHLAISVMTFRSRGSTDDILVACDDIKAKFAGVNPIHYYSSV